MQDLVESKSYLTIVRNAHNLADILKKWRPDLRPQTDELQTIVARAHVKLDALCQLSQEATSLSEQEGREHSPSVGDAGEAADALNTLEAAYQSLDDLKRANIHPLER
jgi:hypothetical protein